MKTLAYLWMQPVGRVAFAMQCAFGVLYPSAAYGGPLWAHILVSLCIYGGIIAHLLFSEIGRQKRIAAHLFYMGFEVLHNVKDYGVPTSTALVHARLLIIRDAWKYPHLDCKVIMGGKIAITGPGGYQEIAG